MRKLLSALLLLLVGTPALAAITHISDSAVAIAADGDVTVTLGTNTTGDLILCTASQRGMSTTTPAPAMTGYTLLAGAPTDSGTSNYAQRIYLFGKIAGASEGNPTFDVTTDGSANDTVLAQCSVFRGTQSTITSIVAAKACSQSSAQQQNIDYPALTVPLANSLVLVIGQKGDDWTGSSTVAGFTEYVDSTSTLGSDASLVADYQIQTTATNLAAGSFTVTGGANNGSSACSVSIKAPAAAGFPVFTGLPAITARTTSSITIGFTTDMTSTVWGIRQAAGMDPPTCTQIKAGQNSDGAAAIQGWSEATAANVADSHAFSSITDGTVSDGYFCANAAGGDGGVEDIPAMYKTPAFAVAPTVTATSTSGYTQTFTCDGPGITYTVATLKDSSAPSVAQVLAGQNGAGGAALAAANKSVGNTSDTLVVTGLTFPIHDLYTACSYGGFNSAVTTLADAFKAPPAGFQYSAILASVASTSPFVGLTSPAVAASDVIQVSSLTDNGDPVSIYNTADISFPTDGARALLLYEIYDTSAGGFMAHTAGATCAAGGGFPCLWVNNKAPTVDPTSARTVFIYQLGLAIAPLDLTGLCDDPEGDAITVTTVDPLPANLVITNSVMSGTPVVRGITRDVTFRCTDAPGDTFDFD